MYIRRILNLEKTLQRKSCFLLGPRQTGKTSLIKETYQDAKYYNLLEVETFRALSQKPGLIKAELSPKDQLIIIDEIQKLPELLDEVQLITQSSSVKFLLTGSSARKLKRAGVNLLGGRAKSINLHPLVKIELKDQFNLNQALQKGLLPSIYFSDDYYSDLKDYIELYLKEEIAIETQIRNLSNFSRFLDIAALYNSQIINFTNIANDAQVAPSSVKEYFQVLVDTLIANRLPAWTKSKKRKAYSSDKFYFFDIGVTRYLQGRKTLDRNSSDFGEALESYLFHELSTYCDYVSGDNLAYWRSTSGYEVDFLLGEHTAIEIKATERVVSKDLKGLLALKEESIFKNYLLVSLDTRERREAGVEILHLNTFLSRLWNNDFSD